VRIRCVDPDAATMKATRRMRMANAILRRRSFLSAVLACDARCRAAPRWQ
jgi:hypothetical protein